VRYSTPVAKNRCLLLTRGTGAAGLRKLRPSEEGNYGPGVYFYAGPAWHHARAYAERHGGVIVATARLEDVEYHRVAPRWGGRADIAVVRDPRRVRVLGIVPVDQTLDERDFRRAVKRIVRRMSEGC
jgi:hypothetical protein